MPEVTPPSARTRAGGAAPGAGPGPLAGGSLVATAQGCQLCEAARLTPWHHEDDVCWIADCEACDVPMVVWRRHGTEPPAADLDHMLGELERVATGLFGPGAYRVDRVMRQIPDHFHAHARGDRWWYRPGARG